MPSISKSFQSIVAVILLPLLSASIFFNRRILLAERELEMRWRWVLPKNISTLKKAHRVFDIFVPLLPSPCSGGDLHSEHFVTLYGLALSRDAGSQNSAELNLQARVHSSENERPEWHQQTYVYSRRSQVVISSLGCQYGCRILPHESKCKSHQCRCADISVCLPKHSSNPLHFQES